MTNDKTQQSPASGQGSESNPRPDHEQPGKGTPSPQPGTETDEKSARDNKPTASRIDDTPASGVPESTKWSTLQRVWNWKPKAARYDPENPPEFTIWLNMLFGFASCFTVANLYYNQPILNRIAETFHVTFEQASSVATLMQAGYAGGLLLICPLGDIFPRRPFILALVTFTATLWLPLCLTSSLPLFQALSFLAGLTTVTPQLMLPLVGDLAPPHRRASSLAVVVSGLSLGVLVARLLSGVLAAYTHWRGVYWFGLGVQWLVNAACGGVRGYVGMVVGVGRLLVTEPLLVQVAVVAFLLSAVFTSYWTTLSFLLASEPFEYGSVVVGLFGLIGVVVILAAPVYSRLVIDKVVPLASAIMGLSVELVGVVVGTFTGSFHVAGPVIQAIAIDLGSQFTQIGNRAAVYDIQPLARNRVNTAYMVAAFSGQLTGTAVGNRLYAQGGWVYSGSCSIAFIALALIVCLVRGPRETGWVGWSGGWAIRRDDIPSGSSEPDPEVSVEGTELVEICSEGGYHDKNK
ncbi:major facilitator superfamily domain-containing protein [Chaetomium fimeti]|uniref:Major facilitator superfamily domain-containing protein n=1 Tax=Chaetomium fimeti TaxID=1854472 RepID=A0AAE0H954_9PEZI|nr:major facilitator superfamily domain-containing protein [Chaetomium fimeti]